MFDEFYDYTEKLIQAQYDVSKLIKHELTKGEVREEFVMDIIQKRFSNPINLTRGFLQVGKVQSNQMDILLLEQNAPIIGLGTQTIVEPEHCKMVLEVKGNALGNDIKEYNDKIGRMKILNAASYPLFGIFCYRVKLTKKTLLNRFGFTYDAETDTFYDEYDLSQGITGKTISYPNIDFFISIEIDEKGNNKQLYLRKNDVTGRYINSVEFPILKNLFSLTHSLLIT